MDEGDRPTRENLLDALASLDAVEPPRPASQVEPAPFPLDERAVAKTWGIFDPDDEAQDTNPPTPPANGPADRRLREAVDASFVDLRSWLTRHICDSAVRHRFDIAEPALTGVVRQGFADPLYGLCARAAAAAFLKLKLDGTFAADMPFEDALESHPGTLRSSVAREFPRLARRARRLAHGLARAMDRLLERLREDHDPLADALRASDALRAIEDIALLGDLHGVEGRVTCLTLRAPDSSRHAVVYKPRSIDVDDAFYALAERLGGDDGQEVLRPWMLTRGRYGWMQHIRPLDCRSLTDAETYYGRLGWLTALVHALSGRDCHAGNVVAHGDHPVLVDLECLLTPPMAPSPRDAATLVTATAIIPMVRFAVENFRGIDVSGFSGGSEARHFYNDWCLVFGDPRLPRAGRRPAVVAAGSNVPTIDGRRVNPFEFADAFTAGFMQGYRRLLRARERLIAPEGLLDAFSGQPTRVVLRNTGEYAKAIAESTAPSLLTSRDAEIAHYRRCLGDRLPEALDEETRSLLNGWIPRFEARSDTAGNGGRPNAPGAPGQLSGLAHVRRYLADALSEADLADQVRLIEHCVGAMALNRSMRRGGGAAAPLPDGLGGVLAAIVGRLDAGYRPTPEPDWLSYECSRAGTLVAARSHWGSFTGKAGIVGTYLQLEEHGALGADSGLLQHVLSYLSARDRIVCTLPVAGLNGQASFVLLDALARRNRRHDLGALRERALRATCTPSAPTPVGLSGTAGTLLLLTAAHSACPAPDIHSALLKLLETTADSAAFRSLEGAAGSPSDLVVRWSAPWAQFLAIARAARAAEHADIAQRCARIASHPSLQARTLQDRLLRTLLLSELGPASTAEHLGSEIRSLASALAAASPASQYGSGALVGIVCRLDETAGVDVRLRAEISSRYVRQVATFATHHDLSATRGCHFYDVARGMAGIALRLLQLYAKPPSPDTVIF